MNEPIRFQGPPLVLGVVKYQLDRSQRAIWPDIFSDLIFRTIPENNKLEGFSSQIVNSKTTVAILVEPLIEFHIFLRFFGRCFLFDYWCLSVLLQCGRGLFWSYDTLVGTLSLKVVWDRLFSIESCFKDILWSSQGMDLTSRYEIQILSTGTYSFLPISVSKAINRIINNC